MMNPFARHRYAKMLTVCLWLPAFLAAAWLSSLIPPMQSPDEMSHIERAYLISQGQWLLQPMPADLPEANASPEVAAFVERARQQGGRIGGRVDLGLLAFVDAHMDVIRHSDKRFSPAEREAIAKLEWTGKKRYFPLPGTGYYFPAVYVPQALGLALGQSLDLSLQHSYMLARALTLMVCFGLLGLAFRASTPNPVVLALLLLPMSIFQLLSPTIDGLTTSLAVLALSLFMKAADSRRPASAASAWGLAACIFCLTTSRTHLLPLLALPIFLAWQGRSRRDGWLSFGVVLGAFGWTLFALQTTSDPRVVRSHGTAELLHFYAADPTAFIRVVYASLTDPELSAFYKDTFIGVLGWLDTRLPVYFYPLLWAGLGLCALAAVSTQRLRQDWQPRLLLAAMAAASMGLIFMALLVTWTPHPAHLVQGVQGRYFIVPMITLGYALSDFPTQTGTRRRWLAGLVLGGFSVASLSALTMTLLSRYH
jgi:hypothetical protein